MQIVRSLEQLPPELKGGAVTIGNFDGVHRGHAHLIDRLVRHSRQCGGPAVVFTFDPHPLALLKPEWLPVPMTRTERKAELLGELGVDAMIAYPTDWALLSLDPRSFFDRILRDKLAANGIVEGPNFHFGKDRAGDVALLEDFCRSAGITLEVVDPQLLPGADDQLISSSRVRNLILQGAIQEANQLLTRPYRLRGVVARGAARGATIGFPTANLERIKTALPAPGVYACRAWVDRVAYAAATNVGPNPTFGEQAMKFEVHLIDYSGNLYDHTLDVDFLQRLRDIQSFPGLAALVEQLHTDIHKVRNICEPYI